MAPCFFTNRKRVLMTGFTPFNHNKTNPSWEGLHAMDRPVIQNKYDICLIRKKIPVSYKKVNKLVPRLWKKWQPHLTIHVGLSQAVSCFVLETQANNYNFIVENDVKSSPKDIKPACDGPYTEHRTLVTQLDVAAICRKFNSNPEDELHAKISSDAGRYVCEYIYYTSLCYGRSPTLFVHVPLDTYTPDQLAQGLERILELCLQQLCNQDDYYYSYNVV